MNNELYHYGVLGMKWGRRRYQNKDGSLTEYGKRREEIDTRVMSNKKKKDYKPDPDRWVKEDLERSKRLADSSSNMVNQFKSVNERALKRKPTTKMDLSNISDKELRDRINRAFLEKQYNDMFNALDTSRGREYAGRILDTAGTALTISGSALGVALAIKDLKG